MDSISVLQLRGAGTEKILCSWSRDKNELKLSNLIGACKLLCKDQPSFTRPIPSRIETKAGLHEKFDGGKGL